MVLDFNSATPPRWNASMLSNVRAARFHGPSNLARGPVPHATGIGLRLRPWVYKLINRTDFQMGISLDCVLGAISMRTGR